MSNKPNTFTGTVDELLDHCSNLDSEQLQRDIDKHESIEYIMKELDCSNEEAEEIYEELVNNEVKQTVDDLIAEGLVEITGYNEDGEPLFGLTEHGKLAQKILEEDSNNKNKKK